MAGNLDDIGDIDELIEKRTEALKDYKPVGKRIRIVLEENDQIPPTGQFFGINGRGYLLKPGEEADVPDSIIEVLNNAIYGKPVVDPSSKRLIGMRNALRFPYRIIRS